MNNFLNDAGLDLHIKARIVYGKFKALKRINDTTAILLWSGFVPQADVIRRFWPILSPLFDTPEQKYKNCKGEVVYYTDQHKYSTDCSDINAIIGTGIQVTLITDVDCIDIEKETQKAKQHFISDTPE